VSTESTGPSVYTPFLRRFTDEAARDLAETVELYSEVRHGHFASVWCQPDIVQKISGACVTAVKELINLPEYLPVLEALDRCQTALIAQESTLVSFPEIDWSRARLSMKEQVDLNRFLRAKRYFLANQERVFELLVTAVGNVIGGIIQNFPWLGDDEKPTLTVPLVALMADPTSVVEGIIGAVTTEALADAGLFTALQRQLYENHCRITGVVPYQETKKPLIPPGESELPPGRLMDAYLGGTPFVDVLKTEVPFVLPEQARFEHQWIVGGTGHGKTNALTNLIVDDLQRVADGEASLIVIDSQNALIPSIAHLRSFAEGEVLSDKLVLIDATDVEYPVALNLFDVGLQRIKSYSMLDRERLLNTAAEVMQFILASLLGAEMTSRQSTLFGYTLQAMQLIPDATIHTFRELMEPKGRQRYAAELSKLEGRARQFFETQFDAPIFAQTKQQVVARLFAVCENRTFDRMLSNPKSKLDLFTEINSGKVILINTAKDLLKQDGTEIFGRFFLALIAQAAQERATLHPSKRLPCYVYIDECQDYLSTDSNFTVILEQARKQNVGVVVAHQYLTQLSQKTLDSLYANTSIKFAGGVSDKDAYALARNMRCEPAFIAEQPKGSFAGYVRNCTKTAVALKFPLTCLDRSRMSSEQYAKMLHKIRAKYAVYYKVLQDFLARPPVAPEETETVVKRVPQKLPQNGVSEAKSGSPKAAQTPTKPEKRAKWPMPPDET
jgi:hypothetical protein